jgi:HK97 family phage portal protein
MGLISDSLPSFRSAVTSLADPAEWVKEAFGIAHTDTGISVSPLSSLRSTAVYACVNILSQSVAQVPWDVYRKSGKTRAIAKDRAEHYLLHSEPIGTMSSYQYRIALMSNALLYGSGFSEIVRDGANRVKALRPLPAWNVQIYESLDQMSLVYQVTRFDGTVETLDGSDVIHIPCLSLDGISGLSPISQHRQAVALDLAAEGAGAAYFGNGSRPSGYLYSDTNISKQDRDDLEERWHQKYGGVRNTGKVPVLGGGLKWQQLGMTNKDSQYIEARGFQVAEIARIFRVPLIMLGLSEQAGKASEEFFLNFVKLVMAPWVVAIEQEFNRKLFPNTDDIYCKLDLNGLLRGDAAARGALYKDLWSIGAISSNEARDWEELDAIDGGDRHFVQQGFMPLDKVDEVLLKQNAPVEKPAEGTNDKPSVSPARSAHLAWLKDAVTRVRSWKSVIPEHAAKAIEPALRSLATVEGKPLADDFCVRAANELGSGVSEDYAETLMQRFLEESHEA